MNYLDVVTTLHTRGADVSLQDYTFALMITNGEDTEVAYCIAYSPDEFKNSIGDNDGQYLSSKKNEVAALMSKQHIKMLIDYMSELHHAEVQNESLNLTDYKFTGEDTVRVLNSLLKSRIDDMDSASVKDVVGIMKALTEQGALEVGDGGFSKHFVQIYPKYSALCTKCGREFDAQIGIGAKCPHCGQEYRWSEEEDRYYPEVTRL